MKDTANTLERSMYVVVTITSSFPNQYFYNPLTMINYSSQYPTATTPYILL
ncbi:unnamed protein product, partial [Rotaria sp. Silwood2]